MSSKKDKSNNLDKYFMSIAMNLAKERNGLTGLNPSVGCLIVKNNKILSFGQTGFNARLTISLHDPSENIVTKTNIFSDSTGGFSTNDIGIPSSGMIGDWKIIAYSPGSVLQFTEIVHVVSPSENG